MGKLSKGWKLAFVGLLCGCVQHVTTPQAPETTRSQTAELSQWRAPNTTRQARNNADLARDFLELSFHLESGQQLPRFTRFEGPISVRLSGQTNSQMAHDLQNLITRLQNEAQVPIRISNSPMAQIVVEAQPKSYLAQISRRSACFVLPQIAGLADYNALNGRRPVSWRQLQARHKATIFLPSDGTAQEIHDCLHEELAQALGPLNDLYRIPDTVFNDNNIHSSLTPFDMLMLRATYSPALHSGMSRPEVSARIGNILAQINPAGQSSRSSPASGRSATWNAAVKQATTSQRNQTASTQRTLMLSQQFNSRDVRRGFSHFLRGRALMANNSRAAMAHFAQADRIFARDHRMSLYRAYTCVYQSAAALRANRPQDAIARINDIMPTARADGNGMLLASLYLIRAEAHETLGARDAAAQDRQRARRWEVYGFGSRSKIAANRRQIAAMAP